MSDQNDRSPELWSGIDDLWTWVDGNRPLDGREGLLLRMLKLSEEVGEVAQAVIGVTGQKIGRASCRERV